MSNIPVPESPEAIQELLRSPTPVHLQGALAAVPGINDGKPRNSVTTTAWVMEQYEHSKAGGRMVCKNTMLVTSVEKGSYAAPDDVLKEVTMKGVVDLQLTENAPQAILFDGIYNAEIIIAAAGGVLHMLPDSMFLDACHDCGFITDEERKSKYRSLHYCTRPGKPDAGG